MKNIIISVSRETREVNLSKTALGLDGENLQENLVFKFIDEFVDGQARLEYNIDENKNYIILDKEDDSYVLPVKNILTKEGQVFFQLVITDGTDEDNIPVFKSNQFYLIVRESINAVTEAPEGYKLWIEMANTKLNQIDKALEEVANLYIDAEKVEDTATVTITKKDGTQKSVEIKDGKEGKDATINGRNAIEIEAGKNVDIEETEKGIKINAVGGGSGGGAVNSVNGKIGNVNLNAQDVGALPNTTKIPNKTSDLKNDSNFVSDENYTHTDNNYTTNEKNKLANLENYDDTQVKQDINTIKEKIPTQATNNNQLADKDFVNSSLNSITAFYITRNANGDQFNSKAELDSSTTFYSGGEVRVPTRNDYCIVLEDETKANSTTRYIFQNEQWEFQYVVNETALTSEQVKALNSGITLELVAKLQGINLTDVQINNTSIVTDGVANIPCGIPFEYSMAKFSNNVYGNWVYSGVFLDSSGSVRLPNVSDEQIINSMDGSYQIVPVLSRNIRTSVKTAMCDGKGDKWTEDEKLKAQERIGVSKIPSGMTLTADVILEESVEKVDFNEIIVKNYEKLIIYIFRPATTFSSGYGSISFSSNVGGGLGGTDYNAFSTNQKINVRHTMVKTDGTKFEATSEWVNAGNNINDTAFIKSAYKPDVNPYSGYLVINTTQTFPIGTHILIYTK